jgi:GTP-binding protein
MFTLTIVGRPNVGKSTLYNRLTGTRHAIVHDTPGVTRDWREGQGSVGPMEFKIIDTAGWEYAEKDSLQTRMVEMTIMAAHEADILLMLVDGRSGITATDRDIAKRIRKFGKPIALVVNKAESKLDAQLTKDCFALGFGAPALISAEHNEGMADLYELIDRVRSEAGAKDPKNTAFEVEVELTKEEAEAEELPPEVERHISTDPLHIAIIGRPNAGKSTLMNAFLGKERVLVGPEAGITRDAITADFVYKGRAIKLVDTAGMRRKANVQEVLEKMAVGDALRVIRFAQIVIVLLDAQTALEKQDLAIAALVESEGRGLVIAINKWDLVEDKDAYMEAFEERMVDVLPQIKDVPIITLSALKGRNVPAILDAAIKVYALWNTKIGTGALNRWLDEATHAHTPPMVNGIRLKIGYATQTKIRPPTFQLFMSKSEKMPDSYVRYLMNNMRAHFRLPGVPLRFILRKKKNPYDKAKKK